MKKILLFIVILCLINSSCFSAEIDVSADANIRNAEDKTALDYANETEKITGILPESSDAKLKMAAKSSSTSIKVPAIGVITTQIAFVYHLPIKESGKYESWTKKKGSKVIILAAFTTPDDGILWYQPYLSESEGGWMLAKDVQLTGEAVNDKYYHDESYTNTTNEWNEWYWELKKNFSAQTAQDANFERADTLLGEKRIPMYVRDKGKFVYNPEFDIVGINAQKVNLRSQPNSKAKVIDQLSRSDTEKWPLYLGEWTHPNGEHWVLGEYYKNGIEDGRSTAVWIYGDYAEPMTGETFDIVAERIAKEAENYGQSIPYFQIYEDYKVNPFMAESKWIGKIIRVSGTIMKISIIQGRPIVTFLGKHSSGKYVTYLLQFKETDKHQLSYLREEQQLSIKGRVSQLYEDQDSPLHFFLVNIADTEIISN